LKDLSDQNVFDGLANPEPAVLWSWWVFRFFRTFCDDAAKKQ
jgi:hypothetical protein